MPSHQERREPLPKGYQFGDGKYRCDIELRRHYMMPGDRGCECNYLSGAFMYRPDSRYSFYEKGETRK